MLTHLQQSEDLPSTAKSASTTSPTFTIAPLSQDHAAAIFFNWSNSEHWNPTAQGDDLGEVYFPLDSGAFFAGMTISPTTGETKIVSILSGVRHGAEQAWVGFYIVDPAQRGHGYGLKTFQHVLNKHLGNDSARTSIGLDGVMAQVGNYRKSGFTNVAWQNERRHGDLVQLVEVQEAVLADKIRSGGVSGLRDLATVDGAQLAAMEVQYSGLKRPEFVRRWVQFHSGVQETKHRFGTAVLAEDGKVLGFGCIRPAQTSYRIGPIYASSPEVAKQILVKMAIDVVETDKRHPLGVPLEIDIDVPNTNKHAVELFDGLGWKDTFPSLRMWKGPVPEHDVNGVFGIATLEVG
ncbi:hypothetical protein BG005_002792 [Podila minutissima]|nr:hypothetical protein BG005_002792 [Podila minutissima]